MNLYFKKVTLILLIKSFPSKILRRKVSSLQVIVFLKLIRFIKLLYVYIYTNMGLSESALKPFSSFYHIVKYHVIVHVLKYVEKITIAILI